MVNKVFILILICSSYILAQNEFLVNTYQDTTQREPAIAKDASGNYVVAWKSYNQADQNSKGDIYLQLFDSNNTKTGGEELVNSKTTGNQEKPDVAMNSTGDFVVVWSSYTGTDSMYDIMAKIYNKREPALPNEIMVNTFTANSQSDPAVDIRDDGSFAVVWDSWFQDGGDRGVYMQMFDGNGVKQNGEIQVNQTTAFSQAKPRIKFLKDGRIIVVWESFKQDVSTPSGYGLYGRIFNADGTPYGDEFLVNSYTANYQWFGDVDVFDDNSFVVAWCSWEEDGDDGGIYFQRFNPQGEKIGDEVLANVTTANYQWLPKIRTMNGKKIALVWSSWKQDGSREGVYGCMFDENNIRYTFETKINNYTESFQWEPDFIVSGEDQLTVVWSSWGEYDDSYDIKGKTIKFDKPVGYLNPAGYYHSGGKTTGYIYVHVVDSAAVTGDTYEVTFDTTSSIEKMYATIKDKNNLQVKVENFPLDKGENVFYNTQPFDGITVEFKPVYKLDLDYSSSKFVNTTGSNLIFGVTPPTAGQKLIAPIDIALVWGNTDTLSDGRYSEPLDTALNLSGQREVELPFKAWNITVGGKVNMLIKEQPSTKNNRWDPNEEIVFLTPPPYQKLAYNTMAQITSDVPAGSVILPGIGDTNYVYTIRPVTPADVFQFTTAKAQIVTHTENENLTPYSFQVYPNYPNPFNPSTKINYTIPSEGRVVVSVFNMLGEKVSTLLNEVQKAGYHRILFNAARNRMNLASGIYIFTVEYLNKSIAKKMMLLK